MNAKAPSPPHLARGRRAEQIADGFLRAQGFKILERNVRFPVGEIDLVAREREALCFVEVRSRASQAWGGAAASVTRRKQRRLIRAAQWYLQSRRPSFLDARFDVVAIEWQSERAPAVELIRGAFTAD